MYQLFLLFMSMLPFVCHGYTFHSSCSDFRQQQINQGFTEMRNMAGIAADDIGTDQSPRVRQLLKALIGDADQNQLIANLRVLSGLGNINTPKMTIFCNDDHFELVDRNVRGTMTSVRHDTVSDLYYPKEGDANGRLCSDVSGVMGYRYRNKDDPETDYVVFCDRLFDENRDGRVAGLDLASYSTTDQSTGEKGKPGLDQYHLVAATILHEMTHTAVSGLLTEDVTVTYTPVGQSNTVTEKAYGYAKCWNLKKTRPDQVLRNADTYANIAIGLYMAQNNWAWGYAKKIE